jgi:hypothetical protein
MEKNILFLCCLLACASLSWAQVREQNAPMSLGSYDCLVMDLPATDAETARDIWEKFVKDFDGKTKYDKKTGEVFTDNAVIKDINGNNTIDLYASFRQVGPSVQLSVWFNLGGAYLNSRDHGPAFASGQNVLYRYSREVARHQQQELVKAEKKKAEELHGQLKDLEKEKNGLEKDNEGLAKDIEGYKKKIAEAERQIEANKGKIENNNRARGAKQTEIEQQEQKIKEAEKTLKDFK